MAAERNFILGLDLDGVVADFYDTIRPLAAEWLGRRSQDLTPQPTYGLPEWGWAVVRARNTKTFTVGR
jgi:hypothetical protein